MANKAIYNAGISEAVDITPTQAFITQDTDGTTAPERVLYSLLLSSIEDDLTAVPVSVVTAHQAALTITESQISDLDKYTQAEIATILLDYYTSAQVDTLLLGKLDVTNEEITVDLITFDTAAAETVTEGELAWNDTDKTLDLGLNGATLQIGQETVARIRNNSGVAIGDGMAVMFTGAIGGSGKLTGARAVSDGSVEGFALLGIATEAIANNGDGFVTTFGKVRGVSTDGSLYGEVWTDGTLLYCDPAAAGQLTNVEPTGAAWKQPVAAVENAHVSNGTLFVRIPSNPGIHENHDVYISSEADKHLLSYDAASGTWQNTLTLDDTNVAESNVTQHEAAINHDNLTGFVAAEHIDWSADGVEDVHVNRISEGAVTQHEAALSLTESQISDLDKYTQAEVDAALLLKQGVENGHENRTDSTLAFDDGTLTFTHAPAVTSFSFRAGTTTYTKSSAQTVVITDTEGLWFFYYDTSGVLQATQTFVDEIITTYAFVALIYWDATNNTALTLAEERHGWTMDSITHLYNHETIGTRYGSGLQPGDILSDENGSLDTHAQISVGSGTIWDEDIVLNIAADAAPASIPIFYRDGAAGNWRKIAATNFIVSTTGTGRAAWNNPDAGGAGVWGLSEVGSGDYVLMHLYASNDVNDGYFLFMGQATYGTLPAAQNGAATEILNLAVDGMPTVEYKSVATFIVQTSNSYSNTVKSRIRATDGGADYEDWRFVDVGAVLNVSGALSQSLDDLNDVIITAGAKGDLLANNGTNTVNLAVGTDTYVLTADSAEATGMKWAAAAAGGLSNVVEDTTPQLGGNLDMNGFDITGADYGVGTGTGTRIDFMAGDGGTTGGNGGVATLSSGSGNSSASGGTIWIYSGSGTGTSQKSGKIEIYTGAAASNASGGEIILKPAAGDGTGTDGFVQIGGVNGTEAHMRFMEDFANGSNYIQLSAPASITTNRTWVLPSDDPTTAAGQFLTTDASGNLSFAAAAGGLSNVVEDTTPQLGGDLDVQANGLTTSTVNGDMAIEANGTGHIKLNSQVQIHASTTQLELYDSDSADPADFFRFQATNGYGIIALYDNSSANYTAAMELGFNTLEKHRTEGLWEFQGWTYFGGYAQHTVSGLGQNGIINVGPIGANNHLTMDGTQIQAENNSLAIALKLNPYGGDVELGNYDFNADQTVGVGQDNYVLTYDNATGKISLEASAGGGLTDVVDDTTPQLGGNLDVNGKTIIALDASVSDTDGGNILLTAGDGLGTGDQGTIIIQGGTGGATHSGTVDIQIIGGDGGVTSGSGQGISIKGGASNDSYGGHITLTTGAGVSSANNGEISFKNAAGSTTATRVGFYEGAANGTNRIYLSAPNSVTSNRYWQLPDDDPSTVSGQFMTTDASGNLGFAAALSNVVEDTTPQLGGSLDVNSNSIVSVSNGDIVLAPNGTGAIDLQTRVEIDAYSEKQLTATSSSGAITFALGGSSAGSNNFDVSITENITSITLSDPPATGNMVPILIFLKQDTTGGWTVGGWPASVKWPGGVAPTISAASNAVDVISGFTIDGGTTWYLQKIMEDMQ